jgi:hypothetical protein
MRTSFWPVAVASAFPFIWMLLLFEPPAFLKRLSSHACERTEFGDPNRASITSSRTKPPFSLFAAAHMEAALFLTSTLNTLNKTAHYGFATRATQSSLP